jgi:hypothetical protein
MTAELLYKHWEDKMSHPDYFETTAVRNSVINFEKFFIANKAAGPTHNDEEEGEARQ